MDSIKKNSLFVILLLLLFFACTETGDYGTFSGKRVPDQEIWNAVITVSRAGKISTRVYAAHLVKYEDTKDMFISDSMRIDFYEDGKHSSYLIADSGIVNERKENIVAIGNVVMVSDSGFTAYTDSLFWIKESDKVYTNGAIQIFSEQDTLYGTNFESDTRLENWIIYNPLGKTMRKFDK
ncbi:MAG: LPS export ABC transporter periplasmic protein LptC [Candidatus Marinimicrobia bacterium]|jgi:LPS export ABC transporter protein LptC|nr:LPS export ABC transporter periplasmic protein LptC [Candidatus Neomarinimicrobiota bacterium]MDD4962232.1 LPS export ABC transporter periplasmic protein LptC [Candidatus Neomarinimicrobiota bacterium]MDX9778332.1 LPS export ABC transporter periplasmic protein LptC [bacterium]